ncbi:MAG: thymidine kinase [Candidatus Tyloplasma litorale]|nr:MAG: thymidine kinase [Mycoplasmatales bacterium]
MRKSRLKIFYGPMFSGKSAYLIKDILNNIDKSKIVFKPKNDLRSTKVYTREGLFFDAISIENSYEIKKYIKDWVQVVYIDEINFFDENLVEIVDWILEQGINVVLSGLDKDYRTEYFPVSKKLIDKADIAIKLKARCFICGEQSSLTARYLNGKPDSKNSKTIISDSSKDEIEYKTVCKKHHPFL